MPEHGFYYLKKTYLVGLAKGQDRNAITMTGCRCGGKDSGLRKNTDQQPQNVFKHGEDGGEKGELKSGSCPPLL